MPYSQIEDRKKASKGGGPVLVLGGKVYISFCTLKISMLLYHFRERA